MKLVLHVGVLAGIGFQIYGLKVIHPGLAVFFIGSMMVYVAHEALKRQG